MIWALLILVVIIAVPFVREAMKPQMDDTEVQEKLVRNSGVDWVLAQPVHLTDDELDLPAYVS